MKMNNQLENIQRTVREAHLGEIGVGADRSASRHCQSAGLTCKNALLADLGVRASKVSWGHAMPGLSRYNSRSLKAKHFELIISGIVSGFT